MDADEIRTLLGEMVFERAQKYRRRILQSSCTTNEDGVRHVSALVQGNGADCFYTQVWLRENGSFVSASCDCPYNQNGDGTYCKHIGALLLEDAAKHPAPMAPTAPETIPGVVRGPDGLNPAASRKDSYASGLEMLFGRKWRATPPSPTRRPASCWRPTSRVPCRTWARPEIPLRTPALWSWNRS